MMKTMNRKYMAWLVSMLIAMVLFPSCERESFEVTFQPSEANTLTLKLLCNDEEGSRSVDNMDNEDKIVSLDVFLYPETANFETEPIVSKKSISVTADEKTTVNITLSNDEVDALFGKEGESGATDKCRIYVIANRPNTTTFNNVEKYTVNELKALTVTADFAEFTDGQYQKQDNFVMDSKYADKENKAIDVVTLNRQTHALSGTVSLYRAASKITLEITAVTDVAVTDENGNQLYQEDKDGDQVTDENGNPIPLVWKATKNAMKVRLSDGVNKTTIDNTVAPYTIQKTEDQNDYFSFGSGKDVNLVEAESEGKTFWVHSPAFYSYPMDWSEKAVTKSEEPYLTLIVPWVRSDKAQSYESTYYQIPISTITKKLERNTHYHIKLKVSRLGSIVEEKPTIISPSSYIIVPWQTQNVNAYLQDYRYLMVEEKDVKIYNENEIRIPYSSSHEVKLELVSCKHEDLNDGIDDDVTTLIQGVHYYLEDGCIVYHKDLINDFTDTNFDFTPYKVELKISHTTATNGVYMSETVKITQYPAIYGERDVNTDAENGGGASGNNGFVWVNGYQSNDYKGDTPYRYVKSENTADHYVGYFDNATSGLSGGGDVTSNTMLVFTISSVQGTKYVIGDPREETVNTSFVGATHTVGGETYSIWEKAPGVEDGASRFLTNYYATETTHDRLKNASNSNATTAQIYSNDAAAAAAERTYNMIAPKFRISSGYGAISSDGDRRYYNLMKKRCASYQEDGYPAGRWRLPTKAEFEFIIYLSYAKKIPKLFSESLNYWCAHGHGQPNTTNGTVNMGYKTDFGSKSVSVRCVYDDWYWGSDPVIDTKTVNDYFIWGDQPR